MVIGILALVALAVVLYEQVQSGSDTVEDLGGYVDTSDTSNVDRIARAIATAEGFYVMFSRPARNHNPGDMTADLVGRAIGKDGMFVVYANDEDGWSNLRAQINAWLNGSSRHAGPDSTIADISQFYTTTEQEIWAANVAGYLGVPVDTQIGRVS